jgi:hypothetical protein
VLCVNPFRLKKPSQSFGLVVVGRDDVPLTYLGPTLALLAGLAYPTLAEPKPTLALALALALA